VCFTVHIFQATSKARVDVNQLYSMNKTKRTLRKIKNIYEHFIYQWKSERCPQPTGFVLFGRQNLRLGATIQDTASQIHHQPQSWQSWPGTMAMHVISVGLEEASPFFVSRARSRGMPPEPGRCRSIVACCCGTTKAPRRSCTCPICRMWAGHSWTWRNPKRLWKTTPDFWQWNTSLSGFASHGAGFVWRETSMSKMSKHSLPKHPRTGMVIRRTAHHSLVVLSKVN
jgi:hypothetical protein